MASTPIVSTLAGNIYSLLLQNVLCTFITIIMQFSAPVIWSRAKALGVQGAHALGKRLRVMLASPSQMAKETNQPTNPLSALQLPLNYFYEVFYTLEGHAVKAGIRSSSPFGWGIRR